MRTSEEVVAERPEWLSQKLAETIRNHRTTIILAVLWRRRWELSVTGRRIHQRLFVLIVAFLISGELPVSANMLRLPFVAKPSAVWVSEGTAASTIPGEDHWANVPNQNPNCLFHPPSLHQVARESRPHWASINGVSIACLQKAFGEPFAWSYQRPIAIPDNIKGWGLAAVPNYYPNCVSTKCAKPRLFQPHLAWQWQHFGLQ